MASSEGSQVVLNATEGWKSWQIGLAVGAPICLGLAGLWFYRRSRAGKGSPSKSNKAPQKTGESQQPSEGKPAASAPPKPTQDTPTAKAQALKNKGNKYFKGGKFDEAIKCYTEALEVCPRENTQDISTFYANRAAAYEKLRDHVQVVEDCTEALKLNNKYAKALARRANASEQLGRLQQSLEDVTGLCILEGFQNPATLQMADRVLKDLGRTKAKEELQKREPSMPSNHFMRTYLQTFVQDPVQSCFPATESETAVEAESRPEETEGKEGNQSVEETEEQGEDQSVEQTGNHVSASEADDNSGETVSQSEANHIPNQDCSFKYAVERLRAEAYHEVTDHCTAEITLEPASQYHDLALLLRATFSCLSGHTTEAFKDLNQLLLVENLDKKVRVNALIKRGSLYVQNDQQTEGLADFALAARIDPDNSDIYHHRGHQNIQLERLDDALRDFENSIAKNPDFPTSYIQKAFVEHKRASLEQNTAKLEKAINSYEVALKRFPDSADGHALYAQALCDLGRFEDADSEFEKAIKLDPNNGNTLVQRGLLKLQWKQQLDEPCELIKKAIDIDSKCEYAYEILGTIEVQRGDMPHAVGLFKTAIKYCRTETELAHLFSLLHAAQAQLKAAQTLGIPMPAHFNPGAGN